MDRRQVLTRSSDSPPSSIPWLTRVISRNASWHGLVEAQPLPEMRNVQYESMMQLELLCRRRTAPSRVPQACHAVDDCSSINLNSTCSRSHAATDEC